MIRIECDHDSFCPTKAEDLTNLKGWFVVSFIKNSPGVGTCCSVSIGPFMADKQELRNAGSDLHACCLSHAVSATQAALDAWLKENKPTAPKPAAESIASLNALPDEPL